MQVGTKVRTKYEHSETGIVVRTRRSELPLPTPEWNIIKSDIDGARLCIHNEMLSISNQ